MQFKKWLGDDFQQWFNGSKVVDPAGRPLRVYHGTRTSFGKFKPAQPGGGIFFTASPNVAAAYAFKYGKSKIDQEFVNLQNKLTTLGVDKFDVHKHPEWKELESRARIEGSRTVPVFLSIKKPYVISGEMESDLVNRIKDDPKEIAKLKQRGFDGIHVMDALDRPRVPYNRADADLAKDRADLWVVFSPEQIRNAITLDENVEIDDARKEWLEKGTDSSYFHRWFRGSKIVDASGKPLRVYHGTGSDFSKFDLSKSGKTDSNWFGQGFYFTPFPDISAQYAYGGRPNTMPVYLSIKNPFDWREGIGNSLRTGPADSAAMREKLIGQGYDGVLVYDDVVKSDAPASDDAWHKVLTWYQDNKPGMRVSRHMLDAALKNGIKADDFRSYYGHEVTKMMPKHRTLREIVAFYPEQIKSATANQGTFDPTDQDILK